MNNIRKVLTALAITILLGSFNNPKAGEGANSAPLPDLIVANAIITKDRTGKFMESLTLTITNGCAAVAGSSDVLATFKESADPAAKSLYFVGHPIGPLRGGASVTLVISVSGERIDVGAYVDLEVDPYHKVRESDESNNSMTLNPKSPAVGTGGARCQG
jgi:hypothetical protein